MKKATCRITVGGDTFRELDEKNKSFVKEFLDLEEDDFEKLYEKMEIELHIELNQVDNGPKYYAQSYFRVPNYE